MRYVALLRAVNLGPHGKIGMEALRDLAAKVGCENPRTLIASGNLVFDASGSGDALARKLEAELAKRLKLVTRVYVRNAKEWRAAIEANPFPDAARKDPSRFVMLCLDGPPTAAAVAALQKSIVGRETVQAVGRQLYAIYPDGQGESKLGLQKIERALSVTGTGRNWNTVLKIGALLGD
jgi:uncharacterized protein (DUF1697 family)